MLKAYLFVFLFLFFIPQAEALETRVLELKYSVYGGYNFANSILYSGKEGTRLGKKWVSDKHPELRDGLENIQVNRLDISSGAPVIGADVWYFMRPDFAWTLGVSFDAPRDIKEFKFRNNLSEIASENEITHLGQVENLVTGLNGFLGSLGNSYSRGEQQGLSKYKFTLYGLHLGGAFVFIKKVVFSGALSYYYIPEGYNDLNSLDIVLFSSGIDFNISSKVGFRLGGGWFFRDHIMLGFDYRHVEIKYSLTKEVQKGFASVIGGLFDKDVEDFYEAYSENLSGHLAGIEVYLRYFF